MIHPSCGGVLCANCIVRRAAKLHGVVAIRALIDFSVTPIGAKSMRSDYYSSLLNKFPDFQVHWADEVKASWLSAFSHLVEIASLSNKWHDIECAAVALGREEAAAAYPAPSEHAEASGDRSGLPKCAAEQTVGNSEPDQPCIESPG
jgi:hypothetical protein